MFFRDEILNYKQEHILGGKRIIYFEDPFGKIKFEDVGSVFREFETFIEKVKKSQSMVIITSREEIFKIFEKEKEFSEDITPIVETLNLVKPSYDPSQLAMILEKAAKVYDCKWFKNKNLKNFVLWYAKSKLITPLRILQFINASQDLEKIDDLKEEIDRKSEGTKISFSREIDEMGNSKILFLSLAYFELSLYKVRKYYKRLLDHLQLDYLENSLDDCLNWFLGNKVEIYTSFGENYLGFIHPAYKEGFSNSLDKSKPKYIFSDALKELVKDEDYYVRIKAGEAILENIDNIPKEVQCLLKDLTNDNDPWVKRGTKFGIVYSIHKFPSELKKEDWVQRSIQFVEKIEKAALRKELRVQYKFESRREKVGAGICEDCGNYFGNLTYIEGKCLCENCEDFSTPSNQTYNLES